MDRMQAGPEGEEIDVRASGGGVVALTGAGDTQRRGTALSTRPCRHRSNSSSGAGRLERPTNHPHNQPPRPDRSTTF